MLFGFNRQSLHDEPASDGWTGTCLSLAGAACGIRQRLPEGIRGQPWLLAIEDPFAFAAALGALWDAGAIAVLSADTQSGTLGELSSSVYGMLCEQRFTDYPGEQIVLSPVCGSAPLRLDGWASGDAALQLFTSGTTGVRKIVHKTFGQLFGEVANLETVFGAQLTGLPGFTTVSHFHIYGLLFNILWPLVSGRPMPRRRSLYWEEIFSSAGDRGAIIVSSPPHLRFLSDIAAKMPFNWHKSRVFSSGGPLPWEVAARIASITGKAPTEIYGSTETGGIARRCQNESGTAPFAAFPPVDIRITPEGELEVRSPWLETNAWTLTGDRARAVDNRRFFLLGRVDEIVKIAGKRVSLTEMATLLNNNPAILDARVIQVDMDTENRRAALAAILRVSPLHLTTLEGDPRHRQQFIAHLRDDLKQRFEPVVMPRKWRFVSEWPFDERGKLTRQSLLNLVQHG